MKEDGSISFEEIGKTLKEFKNWLLKNHINPGSNSRIDACIRSCQRVHEQLERNGKIVDERGILPIQILSVDSQMLCGIFEAFKNDNLPEMYRDIFRFVSKGPELTKLEKSGSSDVGRNYTFQLSVIAQFKRIGCLIRPSKSDLLVHTKTGDIRFECKRPQNEDTLGPNLLEAYDQLRQRFKKNDKGWIFISLEKVLNRQGGIYELDNFEEFIHLLDEESHRIYASQNKIIEKIKENPQMMLITFVPNIPFRSTRMNVDSVYVSKYLTYTFEERGKLDKQIQKIISKIEKSREIN